MDVTTLEELRKMVKEHKYRIRWAGESGRGRFSVRVQSPEGNVSSVFMNPLDWNYTHASSDSLRFVERDEGCTQVISAYPPSNTSLSQSRAAAVFGVNIGGECESGTCKRYEKIDACTMSYDIETSTKGTRPGGFVLVDAKVLSIAARCSCGHTFYAESVSSSFDSSQLVSKFIREVVDHGPLWLVGWNCYDFDNECMRYHSPAPLLPVFSVSRIGAFGKPSYGSILNIPGTYNIDILVYMKRAQYKLESFKLSSVAKEVQVSLKTKMPDLSEEVDVTELMEYNLNDCLVALEIWKKKELEEIIPSIAVCTCSTVYDCARYVTGTIASHGYSSHVHSIGRSISWTTCTVEQKYTGGYVMAPIRGVHENVFVCDFSSMYPTIIASCNINPHEFELDEIAHSEPIGKVQMKGHNTKVWLEGRTVSFDSSKLSVASEFMQYLMEERAAAKKRYPMKALSVKVLANSWYGCMGYDKSHIYSPSCAAAITAIGRYCVKLAARFFREEGCIVLYSDTDSCMNTASGSREEVQERVDRALERFHDYISSKPIRKMKMVVEEYYPKAIMLDKKRYCMLRTDGSVKYSGVSIARRDVSGLCKEAAEVSIASLFKGSRAQALEHISFFLSVVMQMSSHRSFTLFDVAKYVKKDGKSGYEYPQEGGSREFVPEDAANLAAVVPCDTKRVLESVAAEVERFTVPCSIGRVADIMRESSHSWLY